MVASRSLAMFLPISLLLFYCSDDDSYVCRPVNLFTPTEYTTYGYNAGGKIESISHYVDSDPLSEKIYYNQNNRIAAVDMIGHNRIVYKRHELFYDVNGTPLSMHSMDPGSSDPPDVTSFYHDDMRRLIKMEIPSGNDVVVYRYEYDTNDNVVRIFYTLPGQQEFIGRENLSFDDMSTLHSRYQDLYFLDTYVFRRLPLRQNVESALLYSNGPLYRLNTPTVVTYQYSFNDDGLIVSRSSDYHGIIGEYNFSEVDYVCK